MYRYILHCYWTGQSFCNINKNMYTDEDFMVHVHVYLFLLSLDPVPCFILTIAENLTNPVPKYVGEMENRRFYET